MKKIILTAALLFAVALVQAHEFWLHPDKYFFKPGENLRLSFKVGEGFIGESWDLKTHRIEKLELWNLNSSRNLKDSVSDDAKENLRMRLKDAGTHLVVMQSDNAFIALEADKFNAYLKEDGLDEILEERTKKNALNKPSKEFYSRHTKLLVQVGDKKDDTYKKIMNLPIEIVPEVNPYALKKGDPVRFKVLFEGKPLFGALVKVWNRHDNRTTLQNIYTEKNGVIETRISSPGAWMVSVVKMVPSKQEGADWQSYWGSLVFGVQ